MTHTVMCAEGHVCHGAPPGGMLQILAELPITTPFGSQLFGGVVLIMLIRSLVPGHEQMIFRFYLRVIPVPSFDLLFKGFSSKFVILKKRAEKIFPQKRFD